nr:MAG TPA: hypothetical protein [Caudoviricetes sp.]
MTGGVEVMSDCCENGSCVYYITREEAEKALGGKKC